MRALRYLLATLPQRECYKLLVSTVTPRPIAWVVTQNSAGHLNAAPFSFFNAFSSDPPVIGIGMGSHSSERPKDSRVNIRETGQFVVNLVAEENARAEPNVLRRNQGVEEAPYGQLKLRERAIAKRWRCPPES